MRLENICVSYKNMKILKRFSLDINTDGAFVTALFSPTGSGKTTLLKIIAGIQKGFSGEVIEGKKVSMVFQDGRLFPWYNVMENMLVMKRDGREQAGNYLERLGLLEHAGKLPSELSGGMQQKLCIARAVMSDYDLLVLDEPFKGMDETSKEAAMQFISEENGERPIILVTHEKADALAMADEIIVLDGPPLEMKSRFMVSEGKIWS